MCFKMSERELLLFTTFMFLQNFIQVFSIKGILSLNQQTWQHLLVCWKYRLVALTINRESIPHIKKTPRDPGVVDQLGKCLH